MKVEILEARLKSQDPETGTQYSLEAGDRVTVSDACGREWSDRGWAKDLAGTYPTTERVVVGATVKATKAAHASKTNKTGV